MTYLLDHYLPLVAGIIAFALQIFSRASHPQWHSSMPHCGAYEKPYEFRLPWENKAQSPSSKALGACRPRLRLQSSPVITRTCLITFANWELSRRSQSNRVSALRLCTKRCAWAAWSTDPGSSFQLPAEAHAHRTREVRLSALLNCNCNCDTSSCATPRSEGAPWCISANTLSHANIASQKTP